MDWIDSGKMKIRNPETGEREVHEVPDLETLRNWTLFDGGAETPDGCWVEPNGTCEHGWKAWPRILGLV